MVPIWMAGMRVTKKFVNYVQHESVCHARQLDEQDHLHRSIYYSYRSNTESILQQLSNLHKMLMWDYLKVNFLISLLNVHAHNKWNMSQQQSFHTNKNNIPERNDKSKWSHKIAWWQSRKWNPWDHIWIQRIRDHLAASGKITHLTKDINTIQYVANVVHAQGLVKQTLGKVQQDSVSRKGVETVPEQEKNFLCRLDQVHQL